MNGRTLSLVDFNKPLSEYTIFIPISAFNEDYIVFTIEEALKKAQHPARIYFGVWEHRTEGEFSDLSQYNNLLHATLRYPAPLGVGVARLNAFSFYNQEDFILQIDAHTMFNDNWDTMLLRRWIEIAHTNQHAKIIISNYMPSWGLVDGYPTVLSPTTKNWSKPGYRFPYVPIEITAEESEKIKQNKLFKFGPFIWQNLNKTYSAAVDVFSMSIKEGFNTKQEASIWAWKEGNKMWNAQSLPNIASTPFKASEKKRDIHEHYLYSAHFVFTIGNFIYDITPDPFLMFDGEEQCAALRAWTQGYQIFTITDLLFWHLNKSTIHNPLEREVLNQNLDLMSSKEYENYKNKKFLGVKRSKQILKGEITGFWGATNKQKWNEYQAQCGFDFLEYFQNQERYIVESKNKNKT